MSLTIFPQTSLDPQKDSALRFDVHPQPPGRRSMLEILAAGLFGTLIFLVFSASRLASGWEPSPRTLLLVFGASVVAAFAESRYGRKDLPEGELILEEERLRFRREPKRELMIPYEELWYAHRAGRGGREKIVLLGSEESERLFLDVDSLPAGAADEVLGYIRSRVAKLADGERRLAALESRGEVARLMSSRRAWGTLGLLVLLTGAFALEAAAGAVGEPGGLRDLGANSASRVADGEIFRLATGNLLHASIAHFVSNMTTLIVLGLILEPLLGTGLFLTLFLATCLTGSTGSFLFTQAEVAVGASTGIWGLIGALGVVYWRWQDHFRPTRKTWLALAASFLIPVLLFFLPIDHAGHAGGLVGGVVLALFATRNVELSRLHLHRRGLWAASAALLSALFLLAMLQVALF